MIRPLDLQTMFMNLDKVGKEQAQSKEQIQHQQAAQIQKMNKEHEALAHAVVRTPSSAEAEGQEATTIRPDQRQGQPGGQAPGQRQKKATPADPEAKPEETEWTDPELGRHIDLSG